MEVLVVKYCFFALTVTSLKPPLPLCEHELLQCSFIFPCCLLTHLYKDRSLIPTSMQHLSELAILVIFISYDIDSVEIKCFIHK
jgi:hypothetical protein